MGEVYSNRRRRLAEVLPSCIGWYYVGYSWSPDTARLDDNGPGFCLQFDAWRSMSAESRGCDTACSVLDIHTFAWKADRTSNQETRTHCTCAPWMSDPGWAQRQSAFESRMDKAQSVRTRHTY